MFTLPSLSANSTVPYRRSQPANQSGLVTTSAGPLNHLAEDTLSLSHKAAPRFGADSEFNPNHLRLLAQQALLSAGQLSQPSDVQDVFNPAGLHRQPTPQASMDTITGAASTAQTEPASASARYKLKDKPGRPYKTSVNRQLIGLRSEILDLLNAGKKPKEVQKILNEEYKLNLKGRAIEQFKNHYFESATPRRERTYRLKESYAQPYSNSMNGKLLPIAKKIVTLLNEGKRQAEVTEELIRLYPDLGITKTRGIRDFVNEYLTF
jgi:hypothetical protein